MSRPSFTRRAALLMGMGAVAAGAAAVGAAGPGEPGARMYRRVGIAFGTTVSLEVEASDAASAEAAFAAGFAEIRRVDRLASLTRAEGELFQLNRDGALAKPSADLLAMLRLAQTLFEVTDGAFDVTIQPLWLALDAAARAGRWPEDAEMQTLLARVGQQNLRFDADRVAFAQPGQQITLNSLARGLAADRVAQALQLAGVTRAFFNTDVLGAAGQSPRGGPWRARIRHPRDETRSVGAVELKGCLATSGDYAYTWSSDYRRNHIVDARKGASPADFSAVSVLADSGLLADALSTAAFLVGKTSAGALVRSFGAEALFIDKRGEVTTTAGFPPALV